MSEPQAVATTVEEIATGVFYWEVHDERIDFVSSSHAIRAGDGAVLIDPLPLAAAAAEQLGAATAIILTASVHQRSAWRLRRELGVEIWAPALSREVAEEPDRRYREGDRLPADLLAIFTPGAGTTQHSLLLTGEQRVMFTPDLFAHPAGTPLRFVPAQYMHDPEEARRSAERLLGYDFDVLCTSHGRPVTEAPRAAIAAALAG
jgi:glyoxylase-like metal-dependent hydrolase (beta-lactamase superfamily II)